MPTDEDLQVWAIILLANVLLCLLYHDRGDSMMPWASDSSARSAHQGSVDNENSMAAPWAAELPRASGCGCSGERPSLMRYELGMSRLHTTVILRTQE